MERLTNRDKEIPLPNADNALFWARVHEKLAKYEDAEERCNPCKPTQLECGECEFAKPITNADRIRAMTDEELADEILSWFNWLYAVEWDDKRIIEWLKQEVSTDG
jgi:hypothetical protein